MGFDAAPVEVWASELGVRQPMAGQRYLVIYSVVFSLLIAIFTGLCIWWPKASDSVFYILIGSWCLLPLGNAIFVVAKCRTHRRRFGKVSFTYQLLVLGSFIPWVGLYLYRRFQV